METSLAQSIESIAWDLAESDWTRGPANMPTPVGVGEAQRLLEMAADELRSAPGRERQALAYADRALVCLSRAIGPADDLITRIAELVDNLEELVSPSVAL